MKYSYVLEKNAEGKVLVGAKISIYSHQNDFTIFFIAV